jgi:hypothetical protein
MARPGVGGRSRCCTVRDGCPNVEMDDPTERMSRGILSVPFNGVG